MMLLHPAAELSWSQFTVHPSTVIGLVAIGALYHLRARSGPGAADLVPVALRRGAATEVATLREPFGPTAGQRALFFTGLLVLFFSLNGPLHDLSDYYLFSAHMVQHLLLTLVVPPLLLGGTPGWMLRPLLRVPLIAVIARRLTTIGMSFALFNIVLAAWHIPALYNTALAYHPVHITQHLMFIVSSVLMWWPLMSPLPELPRASYPMQMLYCFVMVIPMSIVSIYIAMADRVLYPLYATAPRVVPWTPMQDQQYGGLIMWIPGGIFFYLVMTVVFFHWSTRAGDDGGAEDVASAQAGWRPSASS
jgi:putative membrane protein